jgi:hypothetical protein
MKRMVAQSLIDKSKKLSNSLSTDDKGNIEVGKNLVVDGTIEQNTYELDKDLEITLNATAISAGFSVYYQHLRVSNGKLNIVVGILQSHPSSDFSGDIFSTNVAVPDSVYSKLYPSLGNCLSSDSKNVVSLDDSGYAQETIPSSAWVTLGAYKSTTNNISIAAVANTKANATLNYVWRFEFNFILS